MADRRDAPGALPLVMGVVNVTPDSFSDGGKWFDADAAVAHGLELSAEGADVLDVGGESTRPGAARVDPDEELRRVIPVIRELAGRGLRVSVDTMRAGVAVAALEAGARIVNDVSGGLADPAMPALVASSGATCVVGHWRGYSAGMGELAVYDDVVAEVRAELGARLAAFEAAGARREQLVAELVARGRRWAALCGVYHRFYRGVAYTVDGKVSVSVCALPESEGLTLTCVISAGCGARR